MPAHGDGRYDFATVALDNIGKSEAPPVGGGDKTTFYDTAPPTQLVVNAPSESGSTTFPVSWSANDATSGIAYYTIEYSSTTDIAWQMWIPATTDTSATFDAPDTDQDFVFRVTAVDHAGNSAQAQARTRVGLAKVYLPVTFRTWARWYQDDRYEPNNTIDQAYGPLLSGELYEAYIWNAQDKSDYYYFTSSSGVPVQIALTNIAPGADYDLYVYEYDGQYRLIASSDGTGNVDEKISFAPVQGRTYYVRIYQFDGFSNQQPYHLRVVY
jgi:hypothetical protein